MIFNEWTYAAFLLVSVAGFALVPRERHAHWLALMGASFYAFYGGPWLLVFVVEILVSRYYLPRGKIALFGIIQAVCLLALVKYGAFFGNVLIHLGALAGLGTHAPLKPFPLPLGLSFFVFEFIHYAADRRQGRAEQTSIPVYGSFILFFPTMIAGPIKRIQDYVPALQRASVNAADLWAGASRIALGLCKKAIIADNINLFLADTLLAPNALDPGGPLTARRITLAFNLLLYSLRIYLDFSSYSDIAIGSARLFGIHVPENFNWPYLARNPSEFWRRWHISLSRWITDYIYIPLGGSRGKSFQRQSFNTLVAMGLSGLWHGAAGNFAVWGVYHALLIITYRLVEPVWRRRVPERLREHAILRCGYVLTNFAAVALGWVFFATPLSVSFRYISRLVGLS